MGRSVPKTGEADVDEEVGTAAGDEENTNGWDCGDRIMSAIIGHSHTQRGVGAEEGRGGDGDGDGDRLTEDGDYDDESG